MSLSDAERETLLRAAATAPSMHNTQPWRFRFTDEAVEVYRDRDRELPAEDPDSRMLHLALGAAVFNLRVAAAHLGYGTRPRAAHDSGRPDLVVEVELGPADAGVESLAALHPVLPQRRTNRNPYLDRRVPNDVRNLLSLSAESEGASLDWVDDLVRLHYLRLTTAEADMEDGFDQARTSERRRWVGGDRSTEGVPTSALGPRPRIRSTPVRDLAATPADARRPAAEFEAHSQLAVLSTGQDTPDEWLRAGQAMERVLLEATGHGVATSLLNQAIEHRQLRWLVRDPLGPWNQPQAVIRFGYGPPVPPTPRRPIADVVQPGEPTTSATDESV